jgi:branched-chain amino acid transport system ATP-binding protein
MSEVLTARNFSAAYGEIPIVRAVTFSVAPGEIVALLGRNGMGKTTLLRGVVGLVPVRDGCLEIMGTDIIGAAPEMIARAGLGYVPAGRGIFGSLSVRENLVMCARDGGEGGKPGAAVDLGAIRHFADSVLSVPACWFGFDVDRYTTARAGGRRSRQAPSTARAGEWTLERVLSLFPRLAKRFQQGGQNLSGGEQQMLAIGRALMTNPRLLLIDEATEGLAPLIARDIWATLEAICRTGVAAIIVDRDVRRLAKIASRAIVLFKGQIVFDGRPDVLLKDEALVQRYIGL